MIMSISPKTAALAFRLHVRVAGGYVDLLSATGDMEKQLEGFYKVAPGGLRLWAKERIEGCLKSAELLRPTFERDLSAALLAEPAGLPCRASRALAELNGSAPTATNSPL